MEQSSLLSSYEMNHTSRGVCLIFVNTIFAPDLHLQERTGSIQDQERLKSTFSKLGFEVRLCTNYSSFRITQTLRQVSREDHSKRDCFVCCFSTHGGDGLYAKDSIFSTQLIYRYFSDRRCKSLISKPKIFVIQACQGQKMDKGTTYHITMDVRDSTSYLRTSYPDVVTTVATVTGHVAWRNIDIGSYFIAKLCEVLDEFGDTMDFINMLTIVNYRMSRVEIDAKNFGFKQMSYYSSSLTKKLYFPAKHGNLELTDHSAIKMNEDTSEESACVQH